jgi:arylsulfatase A-like enzyme
MEERPMRRHLMIVTLILALAVGGMVARGAAAPQAQATPSTRPNVLFLIADDLNVDLGAYGAPVQTPHIDRLAAAGVRFERAYTQFALCSPSRSSFLTGRRPDATGVRTNPLAKTPMSPHFRERLPATVTMPQIFKNNGWFAARVGKLYHYGVPNHIGTASLDDYLSWDLAVNPRGHDREIHDRNHHDWPAGQLRWHAELVRRRGARRGADRRHRRPGSREAARALRARQAAVLPGRGFLPAAHALRGAEEVLRPVRPGPDRAAGAE